MKRRDFIKKMSGLLVLPVIPLALPPKDPSIKAGKGLFRWVEDSQKEYKYTAGVDPIGENKPTIFIGSGQPTSFKKAQEEYDFELYKRMFENSNFYNKNPFKI